MIEQISVGLKTLELALEFGRIVRNASGGWLKKSPYRIVSSLTTVEFSWANGIQTSYYVQDRTIYFRADKTPLPPFMYGTEGDDTIDKLIVDANSLPFRLKSEKPARLRTIVKPEEDIVFGRGDFVRTVLLAHSVNGYPSKDEEIQSETTDWVDKTNVVIIYPPGKEPLNVQVLFQPPGSTGVWKPEKKRAYELRLTTQGRTAIVRESSNPKMGTKHIIKWSW